MSNFKSSLLTILILFALSGAGAPACAERPKAAKQSDDAAHNQSPQQSGSAQVVRELPRGKQVEMRVLAEGSYGQVSAPFIAVARDPQVYAALRGRVGELPLLADGFFKSNSVVAVFTGLRNTGGHAIELTRTERGQLLVSERVPPADMITTQAVTKPFKVVAVPLRDDEDVSLVLQGGLAASLLRPYRIASGEFVTDEGGQAGAGTFRLEGELKVARDGELATVFFDVRGVGAKGSSVLQTTATGIVERGGRFSLTGIEAKTHGSPASRAGGATGQFTGADEKHLELNFASVAPKAAGEFKRAGSLAAMATAPAPAKGQPDASMY